MGCPCGLYISLKVFNKLDKEAQKAILQAAAEERGWLRGYNTYDIQKDFKWLKDRNINVNTVDKKNFLKILKPLHEKYLPQLLGKEMYEVYKSIPVEPEIAWSEKVYLYSQ